MMITPQKFEHLLTVYRAAFKEWATQVGVLDHVRQTDGESPARKSAESKTSAAEASYREARNQLAEGILPAWGTAQGEQYV